MSGTRRYPQWFDGHKVNEILFCEEFRKEHPMICVKGKFFTKDGLVEDEKNLPVEQFWIKGIAQEVDVVVCMKKSWVKF